MPKRLLLLLLLLIPAAASSRPPRPPAGEPGMVSASDPRAVAAGQAMLRAGGSATDAVIATMLALGVVEPEYSGLGGGSFMLRLDPATGRTETFNARETAPAAAGPRWFYDAQGKPLPLREAIPGGRSVGVPGSLALMALAYRAHGRLPWARLFAPAIRLAEDGYVVTPRLANWIKGYAGHVDAGGRAILFAPDGAPKAVGDTIRNPAQAALLRRLAKEGAAPFYAGDLAARIAATVDGAARNPSRMTAADLAGYRVETPPPVCGTYRGYRLCGMGPPSAGGVAVLQILKQLERFDMAALGKGSPVAWHLFAESERLAYADRNRYLGDADFVAVPVAGLIDPGYLARRAALIAPDRTMAEATAGTPPGAPPRVTAPPAEVPGTTHMVAVDRWGEVVSNTSTIESIFGSGLTVDGIFLNNQLTDFDIVPDRDGFLAVNRVAGGKRPRSSMAPTIVFAPDGSVRLAIGAAGGSTIIAQVAKAIVGVLDWHLSAQDAIALPLLYAPGREAVAEKGTALAAMMPALRQLGETVREGPLGLKANAIERVDGHWRGAYDPRSEGVAVGQDAPVPPLAEVMRRNAVPATPE